MSTEDLIYKNINKTVISQRLTVYRVVQRAQGKSYENMSEVFVLNDKLNFAIKTEIQNKRS